jgi:hypothetical protein
MWIEKKTFRKFLLYTQGYTEIHRVYFIFHFFRHEFH